MDEHCKVAFASATDTCKQLVTLATGILALEITFLKDIAPKPSNLDVWILESSWTMLSISVLAGLITLLALTGTVGQESPPKASYIYGRNIKSPMLAQISFFIVGLVLSVVFGMRGV